MEQFPLLANQPEVLPHKRTVVIEVSQFRALLAQFAKDCGSVAELARRVNVSGQFIGDVIAGRKLPGKKLLGVMGARKKMLIEIDGELFNGGGNGE